MDWLAEVHPGTLAAVILAGAISGTAAAVFMYSGGGQSTIASDAGNASASMGGNDTNRSVQIIITTDEDWRLGKIHRPNTVIENGSIVIADGKRNIEYYSTGTYRLKRVNEVVINASIPEPDRSSADASIFVSRNPEYAAPDGSYLRTNRKTYSLHDGRNVITDIPEFNDEFYRFNIKMSREQDTVASPEVSAVTVHAISDRRTPLVYAYGGSIP